MIFLFMMTKQITLPLQLVLLNYHLFYTKRPNKLNKMARFKLLPKRKQSLHPKTNHKTSALYSSTVQNPPVSNNSTVNTTPNDYPLDNASVDSDNDIPVKVYSKRNYAFPPPSF